MSKFASENINDIAPYVPGEQPKDMRYIKLNTNENPYYTSARAVERITKQSLASLNRYSDPENTALCNAIAEFYGVSASEVMVTNGSDEALAFAFMAYGEKGVCYPDVTYGFYDVIANLFKCPVKHIALDADFKINARDYANAGKTIVIANPNAQTGIELPLEDLRFIIENNKNNLVIVDQAYADFGSYNAIYLINKYDNLLTVNTFSKSRSLAGARVGFVGANQNLIEDMKKVKNSFHPYNVNTVSAALAAGAVQDKEYFEQSVKNVKEGRKALTDGLDKLGFKVLPSSTNFVLAKSDLIDGLNLYIKLKEKGVLIRHLSDERISNYIRITVGTEEEIAELLSVIKQILAEK